ncbi:MAG: hypothetical protein ACMG50_00445, partial [Thermomonas sp.]
TTAFKTANAEIGGHWTLVEDDNADYVVVDMDSLYGPMSWLRLHAAGRKVIGLTSVERSQTDYRLMRPLNANDLAVLLSEIEVDTPPAHVDAAPAASTPAPAPADQLPEPQALPNDEVEAIPAETPAMAAVPAAVIPDPEPESAPAPVPAVAIAPDRPLAHWLVGNGLERRVRLKRADGQILLIDPRSKVYHGPATLKPLTAFFEGTLRIEDFETPDAAAWETEAASLGGAQPFARLQWLAGLLAGNGNLLPGNDPDGEYRLTKWPQTEREFPKHFRIATAMMKGPSTLDDIATASGVDRADIADFVNANLATGYAELVLPVVPEPEPPAKVGGGLFGRMRGR